MIEFHNGHKFDFGCASGALGFYGDGWWYEQPWRWCGLLDPHAFTIIIKTLTYGPVKGNYVWWKPWTCIRLLPNGSVVNAVGLTNPGYEWWLGSPYEHIRRRGYKVIVSIAPNNELEAAAMAAAFEHKKIAGIQVNVSCPNVTHNSQLDYVCSMIHTVTKCTSHPVLVKLAYQDDYMGVCKALDGKVAAFELINAVPFKLVHPKKLSPLSRWGYSGAVSGRDIAKMSKEALVNVKRAGIKTPIVSGGGIDSWEEVRERDALEADAQVFGSVFIRKSWLPNRIVKRYRGVRWQASCSTS